MIKNFCLIFLISFVFIIPLKAAQYTIQWIDTLDLSNSDAVYDLAINKNRDILIAGYATLTSNADILTAKFDSSGNLLWVDTFNTSNYDYGYGVAVDTLGNAYVAGYTGAGSGTYNYITIKYNSSGNLVWWDTLDVGGDDYNIGGISVSPDNNIYLGGASNMNSDFYFLSYRYDPNGNITWEDTLYVGSNNHISGVATDGSNNHYFTGSTTIGNSRYYTAKFNTTGTIEWADTTDTSNTVSNASATDIAIDGYGNVCVTGYVSDTTTSYIVTIKYAPSGNLLWADTLIYSDYTYANAVAADQSGNVYVAGYSKINGYNDILTIKYDSNGNIVWADTIDNGNNDTGHGIAVDNNGNIYVAGNSYIGSRHDIIVIKYNNTQGIKEKDNDKTLRVFEVSPLSRGAWMSYSVGISGTYSIELINSTGRIVKKIRADGRGTHLLSVKNLVSGIYFVKFSRGNTVIKRKITIIR